ncbi:ankyrin repeat domain-containing protein [Dyella silvatica]|uniref:ankyrin repeat domain-containing protein n=1 Tax=Dyella silvatica TaxID=2992128 RepID=UPI00225562D5|nr:ankyrin repeat domain-containing protein [Dyella silvatica]
MQKRLIRLALLLLLLALTGCSMPSAASPTPSQESEYDLGAFFKDPKAQALALAAEHGNAQEVRRLMKQEGVNPDVIFSSDDSGMPLVAWPVFTHNADGLKVMLENGANPNARKPGEVVKTYKDGSVGHYLDYENAMVWAAKQDDPIYLKLLLDHGGDPNTRNGNDENLLFQAFIWHNQWRNVQLLVERGADLNDMRQGTSILSSYAFEGQFERTYWLLEHGADPTERRAKPPSPPKALSYPIIEAIYWLPGNPKDPTWQRKCQQWLLQHGYLRPPMPENDRQMRKNLGFPYEEKDIPLL